MDSRTRAKTTKRELTLKRVVAAALMVAAVTVVLFPLYPRLSAKLADRPCAANLAEIGRAIALYGADNDARFPPIVDASDKYLHLWDKQPKLLAQVKRFPLMQTPLLRYVKSPSVFHCSLDNGGYVMDNTFGTGLVRFTSSPTMYATYGSSYLYRTEITFKSLSQKGYWPPANVAMLFDGYGHWHGHTEAMREDMDFRTEAATIDNYRYNALFGDNHVRSLSYMELQATWNKGL